MQRRSLNYKDPIKSWELNETLLGIVLPGRYRGFDSIQKLDATRFNILHNTTAYTQPSKTLVNSGNQGVVRTTQGTTIIEDSAVLNSLYPALVVASNASNPNPRFDIVYVEHEYTETVGGVGATYGVKQGDNLGQIPQVDNPLKQVAIGMISIPAGANLLDVNTIYTAGEVPTIARATNYANNNYIAQGDSYRQAIAKLDARLKITNDDALGLIPITYANLISLVGSDTLKVGARYLITDFKTIHEVPNLATVTTNIVFEPTSDEIDPLIVEAVTTGELSHIAKSTKYPQDIIHYTIDNLAPGSEYGWITYRMDTMKNIECPFDWRHCIWARFQVGLETAGNYTGITNNVFLSEPRFTLTDKLGANCVNVTMRSHGIHDYNNFPNANTPLYLPNIVIRTPIAQGLYIGLGRGGICPNLGYGGTPNPTITGLRLTDLYDSYSSLSAYYAAQHVNRNFQRTTITGNI